MRGAYYGTALDELLIFIITLATVAPRSIFKLVVGLCHLN